LNEESTVKKLIVGALGATVMSLTLASSQAQSPAQGPAQIANAKPAALCGPGYMPTNISYSGGVVKSYQCSKTIPDQRPCNAHMNKLDNPQQIVGNSLKLSYVCALPEQ
jgi:hypothetical protein